MGKRTRWPWRRRETTPEIVTALGWFSYGLGVLQLLRPGTVNRLFGVPSDDANETLQQGIGLREIASGTGILFRERKTPWVWGRVAGDVMDLAVLGAVLRTGLGRNRKLIPAILFIASIFVIDLRTALRLSTGSERA